MPVRPRGLSFPPTRRQPECASSHLLQFLRSSPPWRRSPPTTPTGPSRSALRAAGGLRRPPAGSQTVEPAVPGMHELEPAAERAALRVAQPGQRRLEVALVLLTFVL